MRGRQLGAGCHPAQGEIIFGSEETRCTVRQLRLREPRDFPRTDSHVRTKTKSAKVWWAVLASIVGTCSSVFRWLPSAGGQHDLAVEEQAGAELTIMHRPTDAAAPGPKNAPMTTVDPARKSADAPKEKTFEANANSIAAAEKAATTDNQLPGQDGKDRPFMNLEIMIIRWRTKERRRNRNRRLTPPPEKQPTPSNVEADPACAASDARTESARAADANAATRSPPHLRPAETEIPTPTATPTPTPESIAPRPTPASAYRDLQQKT